MNRRPRVLLVTGIGGARGSTALAAAVAVALANSEGEPAQVLLWDLVGAQRPRPALLASPAARELEAVLREGEPGCGAVARGHVCAVGSEEEVESERIAALLATLPAAAIAVLHVPPELVAAELEAPRLGAGGALLRAELPRDRSLAALAVRELRGAGLRVKVATRSLGRIAGRRALSGIDPGGLASRRAARVGRALLGESGQALPAVLGAAAVLMAGAMVLTAVGGAVTGKGRVQRAADLSAISAARSMRDDFPRLFVPPTLPNGLPNPAHISKARYLARATVAAFQAGRMNGVPPWRLRVGFPDALAFAPVRARVRIAARVDPGPVPRAPPIPVETSAVAEVSPPTAWTGMMPSATEGGGYVGPLAYRQGKPMRPDVAAAFDRMASAASRAGIHLIVVSGYRSNAEQARLFAAHPDPRWVAPPGRSLHRCGTELDLGPAGAYGWLAANATRFGFVKRYS